MQRKTNYITIPTEEYERLTRSDAYLQAIVKAPNYQRKEATEAIVAALTPPRQTGEAGADL